MFVLDRTRRHVPSEFDLINGTHAIVYSALGSHASYPMCGE